MFIGDPALWICGTISEPSVGNGPRLGSNHDRLTRRQSWLTNILLKSGDRFQDLRADTRRLTWDGFDGRLMSFARSERQTAIWLSI